MKAWYYGLSCDQHGWLVMIVGITLQMVLNVLAYRFAVWFWS